MDTQEMSITAGLGGRLHCSLVSVITLQILNYVHNLVSVQKNEVIECNDMNTIER